jgi:exosortase
MIRLTPKSRFLFLCAAVLPIAWHPIATTFSLAWNNDEYTHILLIIPIAATLILLDWRRVERLSAPSPGWGAVLLFASLLGLGFANWGRAELRPDEQLAISMAGLVVWWIGSFVLCFGADASQVVLFPLGFLFWLAPFPQAMLDRIVSLLQQGSTVAADLLFMIAGVPVIHDGVRLLIPGLTLEVAKECSSIRSSLMLMVTTMVLAQLFLRSPWRKILMVALVVPLAVAKNGLRIFTIAMLGTKVDPGFLTGRLHHDGGIVFFLISLGVIFLLLWVFRRRDVKPVLTGG